MSTFDFDEQFPVLKPACRALGRISVRLGRILVLSPIRGVWRRRKPILAVIAILVVAHSITTLILGRRVRLQIETLRARGEPVSMADLAGPKIPDSQNGAVIYAKAFAITSGEKSGKELDDACDLVSRKKRAENPKIWTEARAVLAKYGGIFPIIEKAASMPRCQFPVNWEAGLGATFPHFSKIRTLGRLLSARAILQARDGDVSGALHSIGLAFKVGESVKDEPSIIGVLVRISVIKVSSSALQDVLRSAAAESITEAQARRLYDSLGEIDVAPGFVRAMQGERAFGMSAFDLVRKEGLNAYPYLLGGDKAHIPQPLNAVLANPMRPILYADEIFYIDYMNRVVQRAPALSRDIYAQEPRGGYEPEFPRYALVSRIVLPVFTRARKSRDDATAMIAGSRIALALVTHKSRYGAYPASLADLREKLGWKIEEDAFSGKDFIYKPKGAGFLLYSIGQNLKDDGARPWLKPGIPEGYEYKNAQGDHTADIIWELER